MVYLRVFLVVRGVCTFLGVVRCLFPQVRLHFFLERHQNKSGCDAMRFPGSVRGPVQPLVQRLLVDVDRQVVPEVVREEVRELRPPRGDCVQVTDLQALSKATGQGARTGIIQDA